VCVQPDDGLLLVGDLAAENAQNKILGDHRVYFRRVNGRLICSRRLNQERYAMIPLAVIPARIAPGVVGAKNDPGSVPLARGFHGIAQRAESAIGQRQVAEISVHCV